MCMSWFNMNVDCLGYVSQIIGSLAIYSRVIETICVLYSMLTILIKYLSFCIENQDVYSQSAETLCVWEKTLCLCLSVWSKVQLSFTSELSYIFFSADVDSQNKGHIYWCFYCVIEDLCLDTFIVFVPANSQVLNRCNIDDVTLQSVLCFFSHHISMLYRINNFWILCQTKLDNS